MIETLATLALNAGVSLPPIPTRGNEYQIGPGGPPSLENPAVPFSAAFDIAPDAAGTYVSEEGSLQLTAVYRCASLVSGWIGRTPLNPYRTTAMGKDKARDHYLWPLFKTAANPRMSAYRFRRVMQTWLMLWGNAYAEIEINGRGQVVALWPWRPDRVDITGSPDNPIYTYRMSDGTPVARSADYILHLRALETNGIKGLSPIAVARQSMGLAMAAELYGARFFSNSGKPGGWIEHPGRLGAEAKKTLRESMEAIHRGLRGAHRIAIFEDGMKYHDVGVPPEDMQFLETRKFQIADIARLYGVPLHKLGELSRATFSNIEHQAIEFNQDCLGDWYAAWEAELTMSLLSPREQGAIFIEFDSNYQMRGDTLGRYQAYKIGRDGGWLSRNDVRDKENMNRIEGGDDYLTPLNMVDTNAPPADDPPSDAGDAGANKNQPSGGNPDDEDLDEEAQDDA